MFLVWRLLKRLPAPSTRTSNNVGNSQRCNVLCAYHDCANYHFTSYMRKMRTSHTRRLLGSKRNPSTDLLPGSSSPGSYTRSGTQRSIVSEKQTDLAARRFAAKRGSHKLLASLVIGIGCFSPDSSRYLGQRTQAFRLFARCRRLAHSSDFCTNTLILHPIQVSSKYHFSE